MRAFTLIGLAAGFSRDRGCLQDERRQRETRGLKIHLEDGEACSSRPSRFTITGYLIFDLDGDKHQNQADASKKPKFIDLMGTRKDTRTNRCWDLSTRR